MNMKKLSTILLLTIILLMSFATVFELPKVKANGTEEIVNGGFETGDVTGWDYYASVEVVNDTKHSGNYSCWIEYSGFIRQNINDVSESNISAFTVWIKLDVADEFLYIEISYNDTTSTQYYYEASDTDWHEYNLLSLIPDGKFVSNIAFDNIDDYMLDIWIDDVSLISGGASPTWEVDVFSSLDDGLLTYFMVNNSTYNETFLTPSEVLLSEGDYDFSALNLTLGAYTFDHWLVNGVTHYSEQNITDFTVDDMIDMEIVYNHTFPFFSGFETGDTSEWDLTSGSPSISGTYKRSGSYGMQAKLGSIYEYAEYVKYSLDDPLSTYTATSFILFHSTVGLWADVMSVGYAPFIGFNQYSGNIYAGYASGDYYIMSIELDHWYNLTITYDETTISWYVDSSLGKTIEDYGSASFLDVGIHLGNPSTSFEVWVDDCSLQSNLPPPPPPLYNLQFASEPEINAYFYINGSAHATPYTIEVESGTYNFTAESYIENLPDAFEFLNWNVNGDNYTDNPLLIFINGNATITIYYYHLVFEYFFYDYFETGDFSRQTAYIHTAGANMEVAEEHHHDGVFGAGAKITGWQYQYAWIYKQFNPREVFYTRYWLRINESQYSGTYLARCKGVFGGTLWDSKLGNNYELLFSFTVQNPPNSGNNYVYTYGWTIEPSTWYDIIVGYKSSTVDGWFSVWMNGFLMLNETHWYYTRTSGLPNTIYLGISAAQGIPSGSISFDNERLYDALPSFLHHDYSVSVSSSPEINVNFTVNGAAKITPTSFGVNETICQFVSPEEVTFGAIIYEFSHYTLNGSIIVGSRIADIEINGNTSVVINYTVKGKPPDIPYIPNTVTATWYMRSDTQTTHSILGYKLSTTNSYTYAFDNRYTVISTSSSYGVRVWIIGYQGEQKELTSGNPVAIVTRAVNGIGIQSATWNCPQYDRVISAVMVKVYQRFGTGTWTIRRIYITTSKLWIKFPASTWTFSYYTQLAISSTNSTFYFGSSLYSSRVTLSYYPASVFEVQSIRLYYSDFIGFIFTPWTYFLGDLFWGILLMFGCVTMYLRFNSVRAVLGILWLFGGAGSFLSFFIPSVGLQIAWLVLAIALAATLFKLIK